MGLMRYLSQKMWGNQKDPEGRREKVCWHIEKVARKYNDTGGERGLVGGKSGGRRKERSTKYGGGGGGLLRTRTARKKE